MRNSINRRAFLQLLAGVATAAIAAAPARDVYHATLGPVIEGYDIGLGEARTVWMIYLGDGRYVHTTDLRGALRELPPLEWVDGVLVPKCERA